MFIDMFVIYSARKDAMFIVERPPFTVNGNLKTRVEIHMSKFRNTADSLHVGSVATSTKDTTNSGSVVGISGSDKSSSGVIDQSSNLDRDPLYYCN